MMKATNDATVLGGDFADAVRRILPRSPKKDLGEVTIEPAAPGVLRLSSFYASMEVPAKGSWTDAVAVSGRFLRNLVVGDPPLAIRLVYFGGTLTLNGTSITASAVTGADAARKPRHVPTSRLGR
jgi:hypothetical protein